MKTLKTLTSWVEIPVSDMSRAKKFYETILDIQLQEMKFPNGLTMSFFPVEKTGVGGALCHLESHYKPSSNGVLLYITADPDIETVLEKVEKAGGKVVQTKKQISETAEHGFMALFIDCEDNRIALYYI